MVKASRAALISLTGILPGIIAAVFLSEQSPELFAPKAQAQSLQLQAETPTPAPMPQMNKDQTAVQQTQPGVDSPDNYPRVGGMETAILGRTYPSDQLPSRLNRLESKAFGQTFETLDLSSRTDKLQDYVEDKLHKSVLPENHGVSAAAMEAQQGQGGQNSDQGQTKPGFLAKAANMFLGLPTGPDGKTQGFFVPGIGPFAGIRARPRSAVDPQTGQNLQDQAQEDPRAHQFDDVISSPLPPPSTSRTVAKVGWCEKQVFGKVFADQHLPARLTQLNDRIHFAPGKSGTDLIDDVDKLVQAVAARRPKNPGTM